MASATLTAHPSGPLNGQVRAPGDKSISHRALILGAMADGVTEIEGLLEGDDVLLFGSEGSGAPAHVHEAAACRVRIPIAPDARSLNLAVACAMAAGEALRQTGGWPL